MRYSPVSLQEPPLPQPVRHFPAVYRPCTFITVLHKSPPTVPTQSQMNPVHNLPFNFLQCILTLAGHLCLAYPNWFFPSGSHTKILYAFFFSPTHATSLTHLILLHLNDDVNDDDNYHHHHHHNLSAGG